MASDEWISIAAASQWMGVCHRQALRLLARRDGELDGRLLRSIGTKHMPNGPQPSKLLVSLSVLRESLRPDDSTRDIETLKLEVVGLRRELAAIRRVLQSQGARPPGI